MKSEKEDTMKGGKEEEKLMGPLFPRLHIKDAEKGGPKAKAPPRRACSRVSGSSRMISPGL